LDGRVSLRDGSSLPNLHSGRYPHTRVRGRRPIAEPVSRSLGASRPTDRSSPLLPPLRAERAEASGSVILQWEATPRALHVRAEPLLGVVRSGGWVKVSRVGSESTPASAPPRRLTAEARKGYVP